MAESSEVTLLVKHFPADFSNDDKVDFMKYFGASEVKCISSKNLKGNLTFALFPTKPAADAALKKLHQSKVLDQLLSVEYARGSDLTRNIVLEPSRKGDETDERTAQRKLLENFILRLNSWTNHLDINHPPPSHLKYSYPPPSPEVLVNISHALATHSKFYTQVLHLMNKMNLPCPFTETEYPLKSELINDAFFKLASRSNEGVIQDKKLSSEEESEFESDGEVCAHKEIIPIKRKLNQGKNKIKRPKLLKPIQKVERDKPVIKPEEVFESAVKDHQPKKIAMKLTGELLTLQEGEKPNIEAETSVGGFEILEAPVKESQETDEKEEEKEVTDDTTNFISSEELAANRISQRDQRILPVFKNYQEGVPSCRLYLKNLAKTVTIADLNFIYRRYFIKKEEEQGVMFDIRLMQEGRMKGQAFITLQSIEQAQLALKETNGYILKDKPMVVQYARSSKPK